MADKLKELQAKYGQESVAGISTGQLTMEEFAIFGHVMRNYLKTKCGRKYQAVYGHGRGGPTNRALALTRRAIP